MLRYSSRLPSRLLFAGVGQLRWRSAGSRKTKDKSPRLQVVKTPEELLQEYRNVDIDNLREQYENLNKVRFCEPNRQWISAMFGLESVPKDFNFLDTPESRVRVRKLLKERYGRMSSSISFDQLYFTDINVGDVVDLSLSLDSNNLAVVAELPQDIKDPRYTLINKYGDLEFVSKKRFRFRLPSIFPPEWFNGSVMNEQTILADLGSYAQPIGKVKYKLEENPDRARMFDEIISQDINDTEELTTYIVPSLLSGILSEELSKLNNRAWSLLPDVNLKLETLHNVLQSSNGPVQLNFCEMFRACNLVDLEKVAKVLRSKDPQMIQKSNKRLHNLLTRMLAIGNQYDWVALGKNPFGKVSNTEKMSPEAVYALMLGLRKNNQTYAHDTKNMLPKHVTVVPLKTIVEHNKVVEDYEANEQLHGQLTDYIMQRLKEKSPKTKPQHYERIMDMYRLYIAGSVSSPSCESFLVKIVRRLPSHNHLEITRDVIYELLLRLKEIAPNENPIKWWINFPAPGSGLSLKADLEQEFYGKITKDTLNSFFFVDEEIFNHPRPRFSDVVYCIDSVDAKEIDDGVSVQQLDENKFLVGVFVADPASYVHPNTTVADIAYERASTLYLPDVGAASNGLSMMPEVLTKNIQLGVYGIPQRVLKVSYVVDIANGTAELASDGVKFGVADQFLSTDYDSVHKILENASDADKILNEMSARTNIPASKISADLKALYTAADALRQRAEETGRVTVFNNFSMGRRVDTIKEDAEDILISFKENRRNQQLRSEVLVSELMVNSNRLMGEYFKENKIPGLFKIQNKQPTTPEVAQQLQELQQKKGTVSTNEFFLLSEFLNKSHVAPFPARHDSLAVDAYATVTSPLRRFADLVNHWQLHRYLAEGSPAFRQEHVNAMAYHLEMRADIDKRVSSKIMTFYMFKHLKYLQKSSKEPIRVECVVCRPASDDGILDVVLPDYGVYGVLETSQSDRSRELLSDVEVGDVIKDAVIVDMDLLEGLLVLKSDSY
ncbi:hypothetical protein KL918_003007 [Ogataea parapolymorpha]|uniref:RNB domain-containing protein n=1 Tax=Ogataea parapolymorpha (strain ATCC 26012 / BCRC 20466 / JCM 22074 / NRRL Y-7560 / DL-1) TaxID=871575 RepID=W1QB76_OGAPD|nr:hypothetical protein HPODL_01726 [Ogataea parapolymorpha DL-1]ESW97634.1 hypothetical protein HPODL_01726 [Ogataea parapolymorpha DL-1]KAG7866812.1 hypothetical protein KL918_003007 [Ogataea parapolymorpha]KAG7871963.1 hypothetical protein KL916_003566 [Ogataea parapolymorpha]